MIIKLGFRTFYTCYVFSYNCYHVITIICVPVCQCVWELSQSKDYIPIEPWMLSHADFEELVSQSIYFP